MLLDYLSSIIVLVGTFFIFSATLGIMRFPTFFTRVHAAGLCDAFGVPVVMVGFAVKLGLTFDSVKIILLFLMIWIASTTASYILCKTKFTNADSDD